jgi:hypothetical protein
MKSLDLTEIIRMISNRKPKSNTKKKGREKLGWTREVKELT